MPPLVLWTRSLERSFLAVPLILQATMVQRPVVGPIAPTYEVFDPILCATPRARVSGVRFGGSIIVDPFARELYLFIENVIYFPI